MKVETFTGTPFDVGVELVIGMLMPTIEQAVGQMTDSEGRDFLAGVYSGLTASLMVHLSYDDILRLLTAGSTTVERLKQAEPAH